MLCLLHFPPHLGLWCTLERSQTVCCHCRISVTASGQQLVCPIIFLNQFQNWFDFCDPQAATIAQRLKGRNIGFAISDAALDVIVEVCAYSH